ncbi:Protein translocase subunit SecD [Frankia canadensis]|uniref:Protein translocase subunit SecD n=1 Tax=Frankia canadensis TaxID=1836972 RepID=A0A2I2KYK8_9ACTN|nr:protein translocase subunit SecD [Frankia canadensis]SNQ50753.1 Protein translocase subunit SecD [Frankia canadensis]SOU58043.1 Protein translocase subunit SecD [Frankia canadensis]
MARRSARVSAGSSAWTRLGILTGLLAILYGLMAITGNWTPRLGLDLQGGTSVILTPKAISGSSVDSGAINQAVDIIRQRVDGLGVAESEVHRTGNQIEISVPGRGRNDVVDLVGQTAELRFREVYQTAAATPAPAPKPTTSAPAAPTPAAGATPTPGAGTSTGAPASPRPSASASPSASNRPAALGDGSGLVAQPVALAAAGGTHTSAAGSVVTAASVAPGAATSSSPAASVAPVASTAPAAPAASASPAPSTTAAAGDAGTPPADAVARYNALTCAASDVRQASVSTDRPTDWTAACERNGTTKYLLMPASVVGTDVKTASAGLQGGGGTTNINTGQWVVNVEFTGSGQSKFTKLTERTINKQVAIVLDGVVQSAPVTNERIAGSAQISGSFTQSDAEDLANVLRYGALPLAFERSQAESISPTLGHDSLHGGLLAGVIGLLLVVAYSFLYYRALGIVVVASLAVSAAIIYASVVLLGAAIGFTLTLAGIAGLIVSIGVTADSFVVYFERIKDEVRSGRTARASADRAWPSARRTMLSADTVSFLAAAVLYILSIGSVRGFAFTLGLSTLSDVLIMFIFTRPMVALLVRRRLFSTSRFSGLSPTSVGGRAAPAPSAAPGRTRLAKRPSPAGQKRES